MVINFFKVSGVISLSYLAIKFTLRNYLEIKLLTSVLQFVALVFEQQVVAKLREFNIIFLKTIKT